jgi:hypothetical protein
VNKNVKQVHKVDGSDLYGCFFLSTLNMIFSVIYTIYERIH